MKRLTFREVIANIKDGEVWQSNRNSSRVRNIKIIRSVVGDPMIEFDFGGNYEYSSYAIKLEDTFTLQRKVYTFQEAFKSYEEGKEIESLVEGQKFKKIGAGDYYFDFDKEQYIHLEWDRDIFSITCIRGEWYIND